MKDLNASQVAQRESPKKKAAQGWKKQIPLEYLGKSVELANGVAFFSSHKASFITGAVIPVDGGMTRSRF